MQILPIFIYFFMRQNALHGAGQARPGLCSAKFHLQCETSLTTWAISTYDVMVAHAYWGQIHHNGTNHSSTRTAEGGSGDRRILEEAGVAQVGERARLVEEDL